MAQVFYANPQTRRVENNGAISFAPGGYADCIGHFAKIGNCPVVVNGVVITRLTCYASGYADTFFSVPANTRYKGKYVKGYFTKDEDGPVFNAIKGI